MWRAVGCPPFPRAPLLRPHVVPLVVPRGRAGLAFFLAGGAELPADVLLSALSPKLAQMLVVEDGLFRAAGVLPFWVRERVPARDMGHCLPAL